MNYAPAYTTAEDFTAERSLFMRRVYGHLAMALLAFTALEAFLLSVPGLREGSLALLGQSRFSWLIVMLAFMGITTFANRMASTSANRSTQYFGLALYVVAEALIFLPLFAIVLRSEFGNGIVLKASLITGGLFIGLSTVALTTEKDLSFMQRFLKVGLWVALGIIVASILFGFSLGLFFMSAMVLLLAGTILYQTQQIYREWPGEMYVAASLHLFAAFVTMLWYIIQILMRMSSRD
jgi:FtsH-binding integral membrane protein